MDMSSNRSTKYEIQQIHVGPNQLGIVASERGVFNTSVAPRELHQKLFTAEQLVQIHATFGMIEGVLASLIEEEEKRLEVDGLKAPRSKVHELLNAAQKAKGEREAAEREAARIEAENLVKRAELEEFDRNLATIRAASE